MKLIPAIVRHGDAKRLFHGLLQAGLSLVASHRFPEEALSERGLAAPPMNGTEAAMSQSLDDGPERSEVAVPQGVESLISSLASHDRLEREGARERLAATGGSAVPPLTKALTARNAYLRWEASKALGQLGDPAAAPSLASALQDDACAVRWSAAKGLVAMGRDALVPVLQALIDRPDSPRLLRAAHYVLRTLSAAGLADDVVPVLQAMGEPDSTIAIPVAAYVALKEIEERWA